MSRAFHDSYQKYYAELISSPVRSNGGLHSLQNSLVESQSDKRFKPFIRERDHLNRLYKHDVNTQSDKQLMSQKSPRARFLKRRERRKRSSVAFMTKLNDNHSPRRDYKYPSPGIGLYSPKSSHLSRAPAISINPESPNFPKYPQFKSEPSSPTPQVQPIKLPRPTSPPRHDVPQMTRRINIYDHVEIPHFPAKFEDLYRNQIKEKKRMTADIKDVFYKLQDRFGNLLFLK